MLFLDIHFTAPACLLLASKQLSPLTVSRLEIRSTVSLEEVLRLLAALVIVWAKRILEIGLTI
ncbi:hypothetical protein D3C85_1767560 [compost metagenome]